MSGSRDSAIFYFLGRYKILFVAILLLAIVTAALESFSVAAFFPLFSSMLSDSPEKPGGILGIIDSLVGLLPFDSPIVAASVLLVSIFVAKTLFNFIMALMVALASTRVLYKVKKQMMDRYSSAHYQYFLDNKQGVFIYNVLSAPQSVSTVLMAGTRLLMSLFRLLALVAVLVFILPWAALAVVILAVIYYGFIHHISKTVSYYLGQRGAEASSEQTVVVNEFFSGFRQIITLNVARGWTERFDKASRTSRDVDLRIQIWNAVPRPLMELSAVGLMLGLILTLKLASPGSFSEALPRLGVFAVALAQILPTLSGIGAARMGLMAALPNMDRAYQTIMGPVPMRKSGSIALESFQRAIAFENVYFAYKERGPVLKGVNLTFEKGKVTAIVGASGAGKTTIVNLILGLFEPTGGRVTVDGVPLQEIKHETWLDKIGSVSQDTFTYHSSITDNILLGRNDHSQESIVEAAKVANAHTFITQHPQGYNAVIGDRGMRLSGGQQQRLAIARAVLDGPEIFIFDEATSSLDIVSESQVQEAIDSVSGDRTVIIVAHRLSTVRHADKIIVLDDCQVVEEGNHDELLSRNGNYARLVGAGR